MNISQPFIKRPVTTILVMVTILFFGITAYKSLPVSDLPNVDYPTIQVKVSYPGANAKTMATTCATPLEKEFMTIDGLNTITSQSSVGQTLLVLQFTLDKSMDSAALDVQSAINRAQPNLPKNLPYNPTYEKVNPSATPILYMALTSPSMTQSQLYDYGHTYLGQRISMTEGVSQVVTYGAPYAARIQVDPEKLAAMQVGIDEVADAIKLGNVNLPTGTLFGEKGEFTVEVQGQLLNAAMYQELAVKSQDGSLVKIKQIGRALDSLKDDKYYLHFSTKTTDKPAVIIAIQRQAGYNTVEVTDRIKQLLPNIKKTLPASLEIHEVFNKADTIVASVNDVKLTLLIAFILVVTVIFLSLGKVFNTVIPALALPMSMVGTFIIMYLLNFSIDILSLLALTLSIGFLVDDAIVVLENNVRHVQMGESPYEGTMKGSKEISMTVLSMSMCLISVFIPLLFMGGVVGRLFREFAITIIAAVFFSGFISLSLTPFLCSRFIPKYSEDEKKGFMEKTADFLNDKLKALYKICLTWVMKHRLIMLSIGLICILASFGFFIILPKAFLPDQDVGFLQGFTEARDGTSPFLMAKYQKEINDIIVEDPAVDMVVSVASFIEDNEGLMFIRLKPYKERGPIQDVIERLMMKFYSVVGVNSFATTLPLINLQVGTEVKALYEFSMTALDQDVLNKYTDELAGKVKKQPGFAQVSTDLQITQPQVEIQIDRDRASDLHVSAAKIEQLFEYAYSDGKISTIDADIDQYDVIIETLPKFYKDPTVLNQLYVRSDINQLVPLNQILNITENVGPLTVNHLNGLPSSTIAFNLKDMPLGTAVSTLESLAADTLPESVSGNVLGTADVFKQSFANLTFLFIITIFVIYVILGILYESFIHPITVMSTLPPATFGGMLTLYIFGETLSLYSFVGLVMLIGIVMKNGIMMVDFANDEKELRQKNSFDAIFSAALIRFRPIMMTSVAALMGAVPIAIGTGGASQGTRPLGLVVVGGLIISQVLTLFLTPVIYYYIDTLHEKFTKKFGKLPFFKGAGENAQKPL